MKSVYDKKLKSLIATPETPLEALQELEEFLECDLYTKFRPEHKLPTGKNRKQEKWYRKDIFLNEKQFLEYLRGHFKICESQIRKLRKGKKK